MCLIAYIPKDKKFPMDLLEVVVDNNPHGFGMMWVENNRLKHIKGLYKLDEIKYMMEDGPKDQVAYHWRYKTRGKVVEEQAHPFVVGNDDIGIMHNGTMSNIKSSDVESDSQIFANGLHKTYEKYGPKYIFGEKIREPMEEIIGSNNRVFLMGNINGKKCIRFLNMDEWKVVRGIPMSNTYSLMNNLRSYSYVPTKRGSIRKVF